MNKTVTFLLIAAGLFVAYFVLRKKVADKGTVSATDAKSDIAEGVLAKAKNCASLPPNEQAACMGLKNTGVVAPVPRGVNVGISSSYTGNGAMEYFSGNGALSYYTNSNN